MILNIFSGNILLLDLFFLYYYKTHQIDKFINPSISPKGRTSTELASLNPSGPALVFSFSATLNTVVWLTSIVTLFPLTPTTLHPSVFHFPVVSSI